MNILGIRRLSVWRPYSNGYALFQGERIVAIVRMTGEPGKYALSVNNERDGTRSIGEFASLAGAKEIAELLCR